MILHNRIDRKILKEQLENDQVERLTMSFYKYSHINNPDELRDKLYLSWESLGVLGRIYLSKEGVNAQISLPKESLDDFQKHLNSIDFLKNIRLNIAIEDNGKSFFKLKIKVKDKIVADGLDDRSFDVTDIGTHLSAEDFNKMTEDPNTIVVDMRNHYESEVGHFENAYLPDADTFRDALPITKEVLAPYRDRNIIMYCTGGIRCEKASAYFKHLGFENIHQLEGGIIKYARDVQSKGLKNKFIGKNFVFDERLGEKVSGEVISKCHQCGAPCDTHTNCINDACHLLFIQCAGCANKMDKCCSSQCQDYIKLPEEEKNERRKIFTHKRNIYRKGRASHLKQY